MNKPTNKQHLEWWAEQSAPAYTCTDCGKTGHRAYVQPQHPYYQGGQEGIALCTNCVAGRNKIRAAERKAVLDAEPHCEVANCHRRGAWRSMGVLLCKAHLDHARRSHQQNCAASGFLGFVVAESYSRDDILRLASKKGAS